MLSVEDMQRSLGKLELHRTIVAAQIPVEQSVLLIRIKSINRN